MTTARISVALSTSDDAATLPAFLESLRAQTLTPHELIVRDDRSVDDTVSIATSFDAPFPVRVEVNERRLGSGVNHGVALSDCTGDLIAVASARDMWLPDRLARAAAAFEGDVGSAFCNATVDGTTAWDEAGFTAPRRAAAERGELLPLVVAYPLLPAATTMIRTDLRDVVSPVPEHVSFDAWLATLVLLLRPYALVDEALLRRPAARVGAPTAVMPDESPTERRRTAVRGARRKLSVRDADLHRQGRRAQAAFYESVIDRFEQTASAYFTAHGLAAPPHADEAVADMAERSVHLRLRGGLPDRRSKRLALVLREVRSGRYARYSSGVLSALQDLAY